MLHEFITLNRDEIITRCRANVAARMIPPPSAAEIDHGVPLFLDQLVATLLSGAESSAEIDFSAGLHGHDLLLQGFTVSQVVHDYGDVCQTITQLAVETNTPIGTDDFRMLNQRLDEAIASAVTNYQRVSQQSSLVQAAERGNERMGFLVHELRNLLNTAIIAFEMLQRGNVGTSGATGAVLNRSLMGLRDLIARSIEDVRMTTGVTRKDRVVVSELVGEIAATATLAADTRGVTLAVGPVPEGLTIDADRQVLAAVVGNLLQNAFKFTRPDTTVTLKVGVSAERVLIEVEDECGGLPGGNVDELFRAFEQRGADRRGLGIGLTFARWGADAHGGRLDARDLPGKGCVFTLDLPRVRVPTGTPAPALAHD